MFNYNPYYQQSYPQYPQYQQSYPQVRGLTGKAVDSIEVVKAMETPLDGSISYYPLLDGSAIVTKQLQNNGTSQTIIYKPSVTNEDGNKTIFGTEEVNYIKKELETIKNQIQKLVGKKGAKLNESNADDTELNVE